jgi:formylglycine-generating enzyme required for sulfatase activity
MVQFPAGSFQMGDQSGSGAVYELPVHTVEISAFYLDQFGVPKVSVTWSTT